MDVDSEVGGGRWRKIIWNFWENNMACLNTLKQEIKTVEKVFLKNHHERFQVISASLDELTCIFIGKNGKKHEITANITVSFIVVDKEVCWITFEIIGC